MSKVATIKHDSQYGYFIVVAGAGYLHRSGDTRTAAISGMWDGEEMYTKPDSSWHKTLDEAVATCEKYGYAHNYQAVPTKKYYKVVKEYVRGQYTSARCGSVNYVIGEWSQAPVDPYGNKTRLFIFDNLDEAKRFAFNESDRVFECQVKTPIKVSPSRFASGNRGYWETFNTLRARHRKVTNESMKKECRVLDLNTRWQNVCVTQAVKLIKKVS